MRDFWKKNFGYIALVPLLEMGEGLTKEHLGGTWPKSINFSSITSNNMSPIAVLPCVPVNQTLLDFIVIPKGICSVKVNKAESSILLYDHFIGYERIVSISDPFKSPLVQFACDNISGYGCPDFHKLLKNGLEDYFKSKKS